MKSSFYNELADVYDQMVDMPHQVEHALPHLEQLLKAANAHTILDVGCATGGHSAALGKLGFQVLGVDPSPALIARARSRPDLPEQVTFEESTLDQWVPRSGQPIDAIICLGHTLPHLTALRPLDNVLTQMAQLLLPGGIVIFELVNPLPLEAERVRVRVVRSWKDEDQEISVMRQWVDAGGAIQLVVTRVVAKPDSTQGVSWDQHLPKIRAADLQAALQRGQWTEITLSGEWNGAPLNEATDQALIVTAKRPA